MFDLPDAKRVLRSELASPRSSRSSSIDSAVLTRFRENAPYQIQHVVGDEETAAAPLAAAEDDQADELEFRLFGPTASNTTAAGSQQAAPARTIRIRSESPVNKEPGFLNPERSQDYYFVTARSLAQKRQFEVAAVSGAAVHARSRSFWPGTSLPWRVTVLPAPSDKGVTVARHADAFKASPAIPLDDARRKRTRMGKKGRIRIRVKAEGVRKAREDAKIAQEVKERAEREKRARRNREKKFKKRARDKAKKVDGGLGEAPGGSQDGAASDMSE